MKISILCVLSLFLTTTNCYSRNLGEMIAEIRVAINDASPILTNRRYSDAFLTSRLNAVQSDIAKKTRALQVRITTMTIAGQREYNFPADMIEPIRLAYLITTSTPPAYRKLEAVTMAGLDFETPNWENAPPGLPTRYYERGQIFGLHPRPSSVFVSTFSIQIDYYATPRPMVVMTDLPFNADPTLLGYHKLLVLGVVNLCRRDMGLPTDETLYYQLLQRMSEEINTRRDLRGGRLQIAPR